MSRKVDVGRGDAQWRNGEVREAGNGRGFPSIRTKRSLDPTDRPGLPDGTTQEDWDLHAELWERRAQGETVLELESPVIRKLTEKGTQRIVDLQKARRLSAGYAPFLAELGLSAEQAGRFEEHLSKIVEASIEAESAIQQLNQARDEFRGRVEANLAPDDVKRYKEFEKRFRTTYDVDGFLGFLESRNIGAGPNTREMVARLIATAEAVTYESSQGPFDGLPDPAYGAEQVIAKLGRDLSQLGKSRESVARLGAEQDIPDTLLSELDAYYAERMRQLQETWHRVQGVADPSVRAKYLEASRK